MIFSKSGSYVVTLVKLVLLAAVLVQAWLLDRLLALFHLSPSKMSVSVYFAWIFLVQFNIKYTAPSPASAQFLGSQMSSEFLKVIVLSDYFSKLKAGNKVFTIFTYSIIYAMYILQGCTRNWDQNPLFCCLVPVPMNKIQSCSTGWRTSDVPAHLHSIYFGLFS